MQLYTYMYLLVPLVVFHLILGIGTPAQGGALTEGRSADATALKPEPVLLQTSAARNTDDNGKDRLTQRTITKRGNAARHTKHVTEEDREIAENISEAEEHGKRKRLIKLNVRDSTRPF